jgi:hypothetical protein
LTGAVPIYKLHGSLNWTKTDSGIELFQDLRPAFRQRRNAAIVPPISEKETPTWLSPVWKEAETELSNAKVWIVCGYSLPSYDMAIEEMFRKSSGEVRHILILDPHSRELRNRYSSIATNANVHCLPGLPDGANRLYSKIDEIRCA